nr:hypothetical protein [Tanacetum cinerariifolium]
MTITTIPLPPPQPQQSFADPTILQRIDKSYEAHEDHKKLYDTLEKSLERDYSDQLLSDLEEARPKKRKRCDVPRTPSGSPPPQLPPPPPPAGASGAPGTSGASGSSHFPPPPPPPPSTDDSIPDEQVHLSDDEYSKNDHLPKADSRKDWWKLLPEEERPATPEPAWTIPSFTVLDVENNWATALVSAYETLDENSLLAKTGVMTHFLNCKGSSPALSVSKIKAASYPDFGLELLVPEQMWIDDVCTYDISAKYGIFHWWFNQQKFYIDRHASSSRRKEVRSNMQILCVVRIKAYSRYEYDYLSEIVLRRADLQEHKIAEKDFNSLYPGDIEDLNLLLSQDFQLGIESYQTQLNLTKLGWDATCYEFKHDYTIIESPRVVVFPVNNNERKIMRFNEIYKFSDGTLTRILEAPAYIVKEFKIKRLNPGMNTRFWTQKDVTWSKEFTTAIERRLKTRRIYRNLECFVGGRVRDIDYRLLQRME